MENYDAVQLSSCVKGELILLKANVPYLYAYLFTDENSRHIKNGNVRGFISLWKYPLI